MGADLLASFRRKRRSGQSMLEFAVLLPIFVLLLQVLVQVEMAISTAIVNQKYARGTLHFLMFNHRNYMEMKFLTKNDGTLMRRFWVGVDDKINYGAATTVKPEAPTRFIGQPRQKLPEDGLAQVEYDEINRRQKVRIRVTAFTCIPPLAANGQNLLTEDNMREDTFSGNYRYCVDRD